MSINEVLDWADCADAASYDVYFDTANPPATLAGSTTTSGWTLSALSYNTTYYWKVVAKNDAGSTAGSVWSFTTETGVPTPSPP